MKRLVAVAVLVWAAIALPCLAFAQTVTISSGVVVTKVNGVNAAAIPVGSGGRVTYILDANSPDTNPNPNTGQYPQGGSIWVDVSFEGVLARAVGGSVLTFNNVVDSSSGTVSDQVSMRPNFVAATSLLGGLSINYVEVDFLSPFVTPPNAPTMLLSDALPLTELASDDAFVILRTDAGDTFVHFEIVQPPGAPTNFQASVSGNVVNMSWAAPTSGGAPRRYTIVARQPGGQPLGTLRVDLATSFSVPAPDGTYSLSVMASNYGGTAETQRITVTVPQPALPPGAPTGLTGAVAGSTATFNWNPPSSGGAAAGYILVAGTTAGFAVPVASLSLPGTPGVVIPGIPPGTFYVRVLATGPGGTSGPSNEVTVVVAAPSAPGTPILNPATVVGNTVTLSWTPGPGDPPTSYLLSAALSPGGAPIATAPVPAAGATFVGVPNGTYYMVVTAVNAAGSSGPSNEVTVVVR